MLLKCFILLSTSLFAKKKMLFVFVCASRWVFSVFESAWRSCTAELDPKDRRLTLDKVAVSSCAGSSV